MIRRLFTTVSAISLIACIAACVLWARSEWEIDQVFSQAKSGSAWWLKSMTGQYRLCWCERSDGGDQVFRTCYPVPAFRPLDWEYPNGWEYREYQPAFASSWEHLGIRYAWGNAFWSLGASRFRPRYLEIVVPYPVVAVLFAVLPTVWLIHRLGRSLMCRRRRTTRHCQNCGYDLRASTDYCPECGTPIPGEVNT